MRGWRRHVFYTRETTRTTWKFRIAALLVVILTAMMTRGFWVAQIGRSLVCAEDVAPSDAIIIENFDPNYLLFERAAALEMAGVAPRTFVPVERLRDPHVPNPFSRGLAELMAQKAGLRHWKIIPFTEAEPVSLNAAVRIRDYLATDHIKSVIVVTRGFRSRRSSLVYQAVLGGAGMQVHCVPVLGIPVERWAETWHGIQEVTEQVLKLQYYRFYVLPFWSR